VSCCFAIKKNPEDQSNLATWSLLVTRSSVEKQGTVSNKAKLALATKQNLARSSGLKWNQKDSDNPLCLRRQQKQQKKIATEMPPNATTNEAATTNTNTPAAASGASASVDAFPLTAMTADMQQHDKAIADQVAKERKEDHQKEKTHWATHGDEAGADGTLLFAAAHQVDQAPNLGDNSAV
jgi:hypothetical protein